MTREIDPMIQSLREQMDRVRDMRTTAGLVIDFARYDSDTFKQNEQLLTSFLNALPIDAMYNNRKSSDIAISTPDPADLRCISTFGVILESGQLGYDDTTGGLVIGERTLKDGKPPRKEVLIAGWQVGERIDSCTLNDPTACVYKVEVPLGPWDEHIVNALKSFTAPQPQDVIKGSFNKMTGTYVIGSENAQTTGVIRIRNAARRYAGHFTNRRLIRGATDIGEGVIGSYCTQSVPLLSSDIEEFRVMAHLETLAAAFSIGERFDEIKDTYTNDLPSHPAERRFGITDYSGVVAVSDLHTLPSTSAVENFAQ